jgi:prevent-host-death family protein
VRPGREERVGVGEAKSHFSELLERVREDAIVVTITRHGRPVARLVPVDLVPTTGHLAEARGWLDDQDPFFDSLRRIERVRSRRRPRRVVPDDR